MATDRFIDDKSTNMYDDVVDENSDELEIIFLKELVSKVDEIVDVSNKIDYSSSVSNTTITSIDFALSESRGTYTLRATVTMYDSARSSSQTKYVDLTLR